MKKTYVTTMPDHVGAFLEASKCIGALGLNITRVSYNKAVDTHTLFIEAEGLPELLLQADEKLRDIGYLQSDAPGQSVVLLEFQLRDIPCGVTGVLELIQAFGFNISYMSSQEQDGEYQRFKMGLFVEQPEQMEAFLRQAETLCPLRVLDYNHAEKTFDNSIFYSSFAGELSRSMGLGEPERQELLIHVNLAMQVLDDQGLSPYRTFDSISKVAQLLAKYRGDAFEPRITEHRITDATRLILIEPPCGSNTAILQHGSDVLFIDTGYACYREEMLLIFRHLLPNFDMMPKHALITHADVDHCGLLDLFDVVDMSAKSADCLHAEVIGEDGFRERNPLHRPYIKICKALTGYRPITGGKTHVFCGHSEPLTHPLESVGHYDFGDLHFEVYEGQGGHLPGEIVLLDYQHNLAFTGDIYVNLKEMTAEQTEYNQYAPILMTSVDTQADVCANERKAIFERLGAGEWQVFGAHGMKKIYHVQA